MKPTGVFLLGKLAQSTKNGLLKTLLMQYTSQNPSPYLDPWDSGIFAIVYLIFFNAALNLSEHYDRRDTGLEEYLSADDHWVTA